MKISFGQVTSCEIWTMLTASAESGCQVSRSILSNQINETTFELNQQEAAFLRDRCLEDCERVAEACGDAAGRAFEQAGLKISQRLKIQPQGWPR